MPTEEILVLASSKKRGGRCVAGITKSREWVRPVSGGPNGLFQAQCGVEGRWPEVLDVVRFGYVEPPLEEPAQPENVLIDGSRWELTGTLPREEAYERLTDSLAAGPLLLGNRGKAVAEEKAAEGLNASLALIEPDSEISLLMRPPEEEWGKFKPRVVFTFGSKVYDLPLTDIPTERAVKAVGVGEYSPQELGFDASGPTLLTVSLGGAYNGWHHKLAAAVLFLPAPA
jgi:hypothetical protein